jgi:ubiquinone/menaquinone biosynthesis C-methylase UbiE
MTALEIQIAGGDTATPLNLQKRLDWIGVVAGPLRGRSVIDCGCGAGEYVRALANLGADAWGIEYSADKIDEAQRLGGLPEGRVAVGDLEAIEFPDDRFDVALINEVLEHVPHDDRAIREIHRILKPGGVAVIFSPNRLYPFETHGVSLRSGAKIPHYTPFVPYVPVRLGLFQYWARNYWPWELRALVRAGGFSIERCAYVWQTFENISGNQPRLIRALRPLLRTVARALEATPVLCAFGVSQLVVARKPNQA